ncbi:MAG: FAD-dependent oxidoreductase [Chloroflexi bacterium]|nr:FAD-dependent oxidoreductase [Chloroflexota bacterium]
MRVAIVGSGPSAFYAAEHLQKQAAAGLHIDMFERLPTPFGLVRGGVAPDHPKIKGVTKVYDRIAQHATFRFYGNVTFGQDLTLADIKRLYHAVIFAVGAQTDRQLGIPGEDLVGSHAATEFVGWYNAHPDFRDLTFDLSQKRAAVIGNGNVAMDVARILARTVNELHSTDIADYALEALAYSQVEEVYVLGRRGPAQAKFTPTEIKELGEMEAAGVMVAPEEVALDSLSQAFVECCADRRVKTNLETLMRYAQQGPGNVPKRIVMRFLVSPVEIIGSEWVEAIKVIKNELRESDDGSLRPRPTDEYETIPVGLVFRSIGYQGVALPDVPFDERRAIIPNDEGRVIGADGEPRVGEYVAGWIKRGPSGIIGTNKPDAQETVNRLLEDCDSLPDPVEPTREALEALLAGRGVRYVTYADWQRLDRLEQEQGAALERPRLKFSRVEDMLAALDT